MRLTDAKAKLLRISHFFLDLLREEKWQNVTAHRVNKSAIQKNKGMRTTKDRIVKQ